MTQLKYTDAAGNPQTFESDHFIPTDLQADKDTKAILKRYPENVESNSIHNPPHYTRGTIQTIEYIMDGNMEFWRGNIIKYGSRAGYKTQAGKSPEQCEIEDLQKVQKYAEFRINQLKGREIV